jgi:glycosyltransferase involved in cell wall biosynthesis
VRPAASVIVGVYNRGREIVACVESLLASTFTDFEIVLVDDGSTDGSREVLERLRAAHPEHRIRVVGNDRNRGASAARNAGMDLAAGELLLFTDSDCLVEPTWLARMVEALRRGDAPAVSGTVRDEARSNLVERAYAGSADVVRKSPNLIEGNMGWRADLGYRLDEAIFGGEGDDLAQRMRADGHAIALVPDAVVVHRHALDFRRYMRMARQQGRGHTRYWYKHGKFLGRDILLGGLAVLTLPLGVLGAKVLAVPAALAALQIAAIVFNELHYKRKPPLEVLAVLPVSICFYAVRLGAALATWARIACGGEGAIRASRRRWLDSRRQLRAAAPRTTQ